MPHRQSKKYKDRQTPSENIIRFEVQEKRMKLYTTRRRLNQGVPDTELCRFLITSRLLADDVAKEELKKYFNRVIKPGDYYSLKEAIKKIENNENLYLSTKARLIHVLKLIDNQNYHTISKARVHYESQGDTDSEKAHLRSEFNRTLRDLADLGINPVTIPERWRIPLIPSIANVYGF